MWCHGWRNTKEQCGVDVVDVDVCANFVQEFAPSLRCVRALPNYVNNVGIALLAKRTIVIFSVSELGSNALVPGGALLHHP